MSEALRALYEGDFEKGEGLLPTDNELSIFEAAAFGRTARLGQILDANPDQAVARHDGFTPLHLAIFGGSPEACRLLIQHGADVDAVSDGNIAQVPPLGTAAFIRSVELARLLLDAGAEVNASGPGGFTALHTAAENDDVELCGLLLGRGADPAIANRRGQRPVDLVQSTSLRALFR
jgi:ankyrin repeat protein